MVAPKTAACKQCRREKEKLFLKGQRCFTEKCGIEKKPYMPGQRPKRRTIESEYYSQLREKQKAKRYYGVLERQFRNYYKRAVQRKGITGQILLQLLETRLDNIVYLCGMATSRNQAKQLISHGHITVDDKRVDIASYQVKEGQTVGINKDSRELQPIIESLESAESLTPPEWLEVNIKNYKAKLLKAPERKEISAPINEQMIIELYSK